MTIRREALRHDARLPLVRELSAVFGPRRARGIKKHVALLFSNLFLVITLCLRRPTPLARVV